MIPNRILFTHTGRRVHFVDDIVHDRVIALNLAFTRCEGFCPTGLSRRRQVQELLGHAAGHEVRLYTLTLDPEHDTPAVLREARKQYGAGSGWTFLTGSVDACEAVRRGLGLYDPDPRIDADKTQHSGLLVMGNDKLGRWSTVSLGLKPERIVQAIDRVRLPADRWQPEPWQS